MNTNNKRTVLVVDDVEMNRKMLSVILADDYNIIEADNGASANEILEQSTELISLILLDIIMPVMDGFTFLKQLRGSERYRELPVILVTTETYEENILNGIQIGAQDVIAKPYTPELVLLRVNNLIELAEKQHYDKKKHGPDTLLIVEDISINRAILRSALEDQYKIVEACNGLEGLKMLRQYGSNIALILLDIIMPVMDGYTMMKAAKRENLLGDIPVIAITAEDSYQKMNKLMEIGICEIIQKPFTPFIIQNRVEYILKLTLSKNNC